MDVRLGGIYALQRIMQDSLRDHPTIANVLATYVRTHASKPPKKGASVPADVHAALTVLAHRDSTRDDFFTLDLRAARLPGIELQRRSVEPANLALADLSNADLSGAYLQGAYLPIANLRGADLRGAHLGNAKLGGAYLDGADLTGADLRGADLGNANLEGTDLRGANLGSANLLGTDLRGANLGNANLFRVDLSRVDLGGAKGMQARQVASALVFSTTKLPSDLAKDPAVKARIAENERMAAESHG
ncbi:pentapeptide repeat-containing protein [Streptomyces wedmorensis]